MKILNNKIQEAYCSFEVSKLLKEKGFHSIKCKSYIVPEGFEDDRISQNLHGDGQWICRPTHSIAIEWIRMNFSIHIHIEHPMRIGDKEYIPIVAKSNRTGYLSNVMENTKYRSPQEATKAALLYVLKNLIQ